MGSRRRCRSPSPGPASDAADRADRRDRGTGPDPGRVRRRASWSTGSVACGSSRPAAFAYLAGCAILLLPGRRARRTVRAVPRRPRLPGDRHRGQLPAASRSSRGSSTPTRRGFGLAFVGSAHNLTLVVIPPLSLAVLAADVAPRRRADGGRCRGRRALILAGSCRSASARPATARTPTQHGPTDVARASARLRVPARRWAPLIAIDLLFIAHWGVGRRIPAAARRGRRRRHRAVLRRRRHRDPAASRARRAGWPTGSGRSA